MPDSLTLSDLVRLRAIEPHAPVLVRPYSYSYFSGLQGSNVHQVIRNAPQPTPPSESMWIMSRREAPTSGQVTFSKPPKAGMWTDYYEPYETLYDTADSMPVMSHENALAMYGLGAVERHALSRISLPVLKVIKSEISDPESKEAIVEALRSPDPERAMIELIRTSVHDALYPGEPGLHGLRKSLKRISRKAVDVVKKFAPVIAIGAAFIPVVGTVVAAAIGASGQFLKMRDEKIAATKAKRAAEAEQAQVAQEIANEEIRVRSQMIQAYDTNPDLFTRLGMPREKFLNLSLNEQSTFFQEAQRRIQAGDVPAAAAPQVPPLSNIRPPMFPGVHPTPVTSLPEPVRMEIPSAPPAGALPSPEPAITKLPEIVQAKPEEKPSTSWLVPAGIAAAALLALSGGGG